jgi:hypothetical protein
LKYEVHMRKMTMDLDGATYPVCQDLDAFQVMGTESTARLPSHRAGLKPWLPDDV